MPCRIGDFLLCSSLQACFHFIHPAAANQVIVLSKRRSFPLKRDGNFDYFHLQIERLLLQERKGCRSISQELTYAIAGRAPVLAFGSIDNGDLVSVELDQRCGHTHIRVRIAHFQIGPDRP